MFKDHLPHCSYLTSLDNCTDGMQISWIRLPRYEDLERVNPGTRTMT
jgi:hypothetical protein